MKIFLCEGKNFLERNLPIVPLKGKRPFVENWSEVNFNDNATLRKYPHCNIGLKTGKHSGIIALDIDSLDKDFQKKINDLLPPLFSGRIGNPKKMPLRFFQYNGEQSRKFQAINIELLSTGNQCVMPPSIHPETNKPYEWIGKSLLEIDIDDLPLLPEGLLSELEKLNDELKESKELEGFSADITESDGSRCNHGSHNKLSQMLVAMILDSDTPQEIVEKLLEHDEKINPKISYFLCPSRKWRIKDRAFNAYQFVMEGFARHLREKKINEVPSNNIKIEIGSSKKTDKKIHNYKKLKELKGLGNLIFKEIYESSYVPRTQFSFASTLSIMSIALGNRYCFDGAYGNLYQYLVAPTGFGKEAPLLAPNDLLLAAGYDDLIGSESPTSDSAIYLELERKREKIFIIDECTTLIRKMIDQRGDYGIRDCLTKLFTKTGSKIKGKVVTYGDTSGKGRVIGNVFSPYVNLLMASTDDGFAASVRTHLFSTGFFSRFLFFFEDRYKMASLSTKRTHFSSDLITILKDLRGAEIDLTDQSEAFEPTFIKGGKQAMNYLEEIHFETEKQKEKFYKETGKTDGMLNRKTLLIKKLALLNHAMQDPYDFTKTLISRKSVEDAAYNIDAITNNAKWHIDSLVSETKLEGDQNRVFRYIEKKTKEGDGASAQSLNNAIRLGRKVNKEIIQDLLIQGRILEENKKYYAVSKYFF